MVIDIDNCIGIGCGNRLDFYGESALAPSPLQWRIGLIYPRGKNPP
jgi:hypothetical protein